MKLSKNYFFSR